MSMRSKKFLRTENSACSGADEFDLVGDDSAFVAVEQKLRQQHWSEPADLRSASLKAFQPFLTPVLTPRVCAFAVDAAALADDVRKTWAARCTRNLELRAVDTTVELLTISEEACSSKQANKVRFELQGSLPEGLEGKMLRRYEIHEARESELRERHMRVVSALDACNAEAAAVPFAVRCWALLLRYQALLGPHDEGAGWHMALMPNVLQTLVKDFGVTCELFASPLNCALPTYCSLFGDTDRWFGSEGCFLGFCRGRLISNGGSFECNPPFAEHVFRLVVRELLAALAACTHPLSVALVVPDWPDSEAIASATNSAYQRACIPVAASDGHAYLNGRQHCCQLRHRIIRQRMRGSLVLMLQNESGADMWPVTEERVARHRQAWTVPDGASS
eukprot:TRINITY_DN60896_c0_g1_i1.p1 TRINITY_DN60896_c0_g1~~TRINITY_DN60896_c0_g1_i1.p1  ORF type:complete len:391 (-),score=52.28 TRINITY_DN60896_c0_g1_i1:489-1661(-)